MSDVLQTVLENPTARGPEAIKASASQAAAEFGPWGTGLDD